MPDAPSVGEGPWKGLPNVKGLGRPNCRSLLREANDARWMQHGMDRVGWSRPVGPRETLDIGPVAWAAWEDCRWRKGAGSLRPSLLAGIFVPRLNEDLAYRGIGFGELYEVPRCLFLEGLECISIGLIRLLCN